MRTSDPALEKKKHDDEACGEIETADYLSSQVTFYVGNFKGVGRIYQRIHTVKVAFAKLYTTKTHITVADILKDQAPPLFEQHINTILRLTVLTTLQPKPCRRKPTAFVDNYTRLF